MGDKLPYYYVLVIPRVLLISRIDCKDRLYWWYSHDSISSSTARRKLKYTNTWCLWLDRSKWFSQNFSPFFAASQKYNDGKYQKCNFLTPISRLGDRNQSSKMKYWSKCWPFTHVAEVGMTLSMASAGSRAAKPYVAALRFMEPVHFNIRAVRLMEALTSKGLERQLMDISTCRGLVWQNV